MNKKKSLDPRSQRARKLIQTAFMDLLREKKYDQITVTEIVERAGLARPTFYNNYETKDYLLHSIIDEVLERFFGDMPKWEVVSQAPDSEELIGINFFRIWKEHAELFTLFNQRDIDQLVIERLKMVFQRYYEEGSFENYSDLNPALANYISSFNAYSFLGMLRQWVEDDMRYPPEVIGQLLFHFINPKLKNEAFEKFRDLIS